MVFRVEKVDGGYAILLPPEVGEEWALRNGSAVEVNRVGSLSSEIAYADREQMLEGYQRTPSHRGDEAGEAEEDAEPQLARAGWWRL